MPPKSTIFPTIFENVDFVKIVLPSRRELNFQGLEPSKNKQKSTQKVTSKKTSQIINQNSFWDSIWLSKTFPKLFKNLKNQLSSPILKSLEKPSYHYPGNRAGSDLSSMEGVQPAGKGETEWKLPPKSNAKKTIQNSKNPLKIMSESAQSIP